ncbi:uncharacterized protein LOC144773261 isoform X6 [Lissotriton helveticus]
MEYYLSSLPQLHYGRGITGEPGSYRHLLQGPAAKQLLEAPLGSKFPQLPGSNILLYTTDLCERLYQPSCGFNLGDPHCRLIETQYKSLHDPHLSAYYKRKDILRRLRKGGYITSNNKIVCTLKEFNEYRQYLTSIKLDFEKCYLKEQRLIEEQVAKLQGINLVPQDPIVQLKEDLLEEGKIHFQKKVTRGKNRYLDMLNRELEKLEFIAEEQRNLRLTKEEKREHDQYKKKKILRKKLEEEWKRKEMQLLMRIGNNIRQEAKIEEQLRRNNAEKANRKHILLEKKMAYHLEKINALFYRSEEMGRHSAGPDEQLKENKKQEDYPLTLLDNEEREFYVAEKKWSRLARGASVASNSKYYYGRHFVRGQCNLATSSSRPRIKSKGSVHKGMKGIGIIRSSGKPTSGHFLPGRGRTGSKNRALSSKKKNETNGMEETRPAEIPKESKELQAKTLIELSHKKASAKAGLETQKAVDQSPEKSSVKKVLQAQKATDQSLERSSAKEGLEARKAIDQSLKRSSAEEGLEAQKPIDQSLERSSAEKGLEAQKATDQSIERSSAEEGLEAQKEIDQSLTKSSAEEGLEVPKAVDESLMRSSAEEELEAQKSIDQSLEKSSAEEGLEAQKAIDQSLEKSTAEEGLEAQKAIDQSLEKSTAEEGPQAQKSIDQGLEKSSAEEVLEAQTSIDQSLEKSSAEEVLEAQKSIDQSLEKSSAEEVLEAQKSIDQSLEKSSAEEVLEAQKSIDQSLEKSSAEEVLEAQTSIDQSLEKPSAEENKIPLIRPEEQTGKDSKMVQTSFTSLEKETLDSPFGILSNLLSDSQHEIIKQSLHEKVSTEELKRIAQNVVTWVVSTVMSILYPALTMYEEKLHSKVYTLSEESGIPSVDISMSSPHSEESSKISETLPLSSSAKVSFTDSELKYEDKSFENEVTSIHEVKRETSMDNILFKITSLQSTDIVDIPEIPTDSPKCTGLPGSDNFDIFFQEDQMDTFPKTSIKPTVDTQLEIPPVLLKTDAVELQPEVRRQEIQVLDLKAKAVSEVLKKDSCLTRPFPSRQYHKGLENDIVHFDQVNVTPTDKSSSERDHISKVFQDLKFDLTATAEDVLDVVFKKITTDISGPTSCRAEVTKTNNQTCINIENTCQMQGASKGGPLSNITEKPGLENLKSKLEVISTADDIVDNILDKLHCVVLDEYTGLLTKDYLNAKNQSEYIASYKTFLVEMSEKPSYVTESADEIVDMVLVKLENFANVKQGLLNDIELPPEASTQHCKAFESNTSNQAIMPNTIKSPAVEIYAEESIRSDFAKQVVKEEIQKAALKIENAQSKVYLRVEELISSVLNFIVSDLDANKIQETGHQQACSSKKDITPSGFPIKMLNKLDPESFRDNGNAKIYESPSINKVLVNKSHKEDALGIEKLTQQIPLCKVPNLEEKQRMTILPANVPGMVIYSEEEPQDIATISTGNINTTVKKKADPEKNFSHELNSEILDQNSRKRPTFSKQYLSSETDFLDAKPETYNQTLSAKDCFLARLYKQHQFANSQEEVCEILKVTENVINEVVAQLLKDLCKYSPLVSSEETLVPEQKSDLNESCLKWHNEMITNNQISPSEVGFMVHDVLETVLTLLHVTSTSDANTAAKLKMYFVDNQKVYTDIKKEDKIQVMPHIQVPAILREEKGATIPNKVKQLSRLATEEYKALCTEAPNYMYESSSGALTLKKRNISEEIIHIILTKLENFVNLKLKSSYILGGHSENIQQKQTAFDTSPNTDLFSELHVYAQRVASTLLSAINNELNITNLIQKNKIVKTKENNVDVSDTTDTAMKHVPKERPASSSKSLQAKTELGISKPLHSDSNFISTFVSNVFEVIANEKCKDQYTFLSHRGIYSSSQACNSRECVLHGIFKDILREGSEKTKHWMLHNVSEIVHDMFLRIMTSLEHPYATSFATYSRKPTQICSEPYLLKSDELQTEIHNINNDKLKSEIDYISREIVKDVFETLCAAVLACNEPLLVTCEKKHDISSENVNISQIGMHALPVSSLINRKEGNNNISTPEQCNVFQKGLTGGQDQSIWQTESLQMKPTTNLSHSKFPGIAEEILKTVLCRLEGFAISKLKCFHPTEKRKSLSEIAFPTVEQVDVNLSLPEEQMSSARLASCPAENTNENLSCYLNQHLDVPLQMKAQKYPLQSKLHLNAKKISHFILKVIQDQLEGSSHSIVLGIINSDEGKKSIQNLIDSVSERDTVYRLDQYAQNIPNPKLSTNIQGCILKQAFKKIEADIKNQQSSEIFHFVQVILNEFFHGILTDLLLLALPLTHHNKVSKSYKQLISEAFIKLNDQTQGAFVSESELAVVTECILRIIFQKLFSAVVTNEDIEQTNLSRDSNYNHSSLASTMFTDEAHTLIWKDVSRQEHDAQLHKDITVIIEGDNVECTNSPKTQKESLGKDDISLYSTKVTAGTQLTSSTSNISEDIAKTVFKELTYFATTKVESLFCPEDQSQPKPSSSIPLPTFHEELGEKKKHLSSYKMFEPAKLENSECVVNLNESASNIKAWKLKEFSKDNLAYAKLNAYAKEVANTILQDIRHKLGRKVQTILSPPSISSFHENILTSRVVNSILDSVKSIYKLPGKELSAQLDRDHLTEQELYDVHYLVSATIKESLILTSAKAGLLLKKKKQGEETEQQIVGYADKKKKRGAVYQKPIKTYPINPSLAVHSPQSIIKEGFLGRMMQRNPELSETEQSTLHNAVEDLLNAIFKQLIADAHFLPYCFTHQRRQELFTQHEYILPLSKNVCTLLNVPHIEMPISKSDITYFANEIINIVLQRLPYIVSTEKAGLTRKQILWDFFEVHDLKEKDKNKLISSLFEIKTSDSYSSSNSDSLVDASVSKTKFTLSLSSPQKQRREVIAKIQHEPPKEEFSVIVEDLNNAIITKLESFIVYKLESALHVDSEIKNVKQKFHKSSHVHKHSRLRADCCQYSTSFSKHKIKIALSSMIVSELKELKHYAAEITYETLIILKSRLDEEIQHVVSWVNNSSLYEHFATAKIVDTILDNVPSDTKSKIPVSVTHVLNEKDLPKASDLTVKLIDKTDCVLLHPFSKQPIFDVKECEIIDVEENKDLLCLEKDKSLPLLAKEESSFKLKTYVHQDSVLQKMIRKKAEYKEQLEFQIADYVENILNDMFQRVTADLNNDQSVLENRQDPSKDVLLSKTTTDFAVETIQIPLLSKSDINIFAHDMVEIVLENLKSVFTVGALAEESSPSKDHFLTSTYSPQKIFEDSIMEGFASDLNAAAEHIIQTVFMRLESFATLKLDSAYSNDNLGIDTLLTKSVTPEIRQCHNPKCSTNQKIQIARFQQTMPSDLEEPNNKINIYKHVREEDEGISAIHMSENILSTYAEKLTSTILRAIRNDLDQEVQHIYSGVNISLEHNVAASDIVDNILDALANENFNTSAVVTTARAHGILDINKESFEIVERSAKKSTLTNLQNYPEISSDISSSSQLLNPVEEVLNEVHQRLMIDASHQPHSPLCFNKDQFSEENKTDGGLVAAASKLRVQSAANDIVETVLEKVYLAINESECTSKGTQTVTEHIYRNEEILTHRECDLKDSADARNKDDDDAMLLQKPTRKLCFTSNSNAQQVAGTLSSLQLAGEGAHSLEFASLSDELVQSVMAKIACFASPKFEPDPRSELLVKDNPQSSFYFNAQLSNKLKHLSTPKFQNVSCSASYNKPVTSNEYIPVDFITNKHSLFVPAHILGDYYESSLAQNHLSKHELELYAKDVITHILGMIKQEIKKENFQQRSCSESNLPFNETKRASNIVDTILQELCGESRYPNAFQKKAISLQESNLPLDQTLSISDISTIGNNSNEIHKPLFDSDYEPKYFRQNRMAERIFHTPEELSNVDLPLKAPIMHYHLDGKAIIKPAFNVELKKDFNQDLYSFENEECEVSNTKKSESVYFDSFAKPDAFVPIEETCSRLSGNPQGSAIENEKHDILQIAENVVSAVLQKIQSLDQSVSLLSFFKEPSFQEINSKFTYNFPPVDATAESLSEVSDSDSIFKSETKLVANEIVETVLEKLYFCFRANVPVESVREDLSNATDHNSVRAAVESYLQRKMDLDESVSSNSSSVAELLSYNFNNNKTTCDAKENEASASFLSSYTSMPELQYCNINNNRAGNVMFDVDRLVVDTIKNVACKLQYFVKFQLNPAAKHHCCDKIQNSTQYIVSTNENELIECISAQVTPLSSLPPWTTKSKSERRNNTPDTKSELLHDFSIMEKLTNTIIKTKIQNNQPFQTQMSAYATLIVSCILTKVKKEIEKQIRLEKVTPESTISEYIVAGELISNILKLCSSFYYTVITEIKEHALSPSILLLVADSICKYPSQDEGMIINKLFAKEGRSNSLNIYGPLFDSEDVNKYKEDSHGHSSLSGIVLDQVNKTELGNETSTLDSPPLWSRSPKSYSYDILSRRFKLKCSTLDSAGQHVSGDIPFLKKMEKQKVIHSKFIPSHDDSVEISSTFKSDILAGSIPESGVSMQYFSTDNVKDASSRKPELYISDNYCDFQYVPRSISYSEENHAKQMVFSSEPLPLPQKLDSKAMSSSMNQSTTKTVSSIQSSFDHYSLDMFSTNNNKCTTCSFQQRCFSQHIPETTCAEDDHKNQTAVTAVLSKQPASVLKIVDFHNRPILDQNPKCASDMKKAVAKSRENVFVMSSSMSPIPNKELRCDSKYFPRTEIYTEEDMVEETFVPCIHLLSTVEVLDLESEDKLDITTKASSGRRNQLARPHKQNTSAKSMCTLVTQNSPSSHNYLHDISSISLKVNVNKHNSNTRQRNGIENYSLEDDSSVAFNRFELEVQPGPRTSAKTLSGPLTNTLTSIPTVRNIFESSLSLEDEINQACNSKHVSETLLDTGEEKQHFHKHVRCKYPTVATRSLILDKEQSTITECLSNVSLSQPSPSGRYIHASPVLSFNKNVGDSHHVSEKVNTRKEEEEKAELTPYEHLSSSLDSPPKISACNNLVCNQSQVTQTSKCPKEKDVQEFVSCQHISSFYRLGDSDIQTIPDIIDKCVSEKSTFSPMPSKSELYDLSFSNPPNHFDRKEHFPDNLSEPVLYKQQGKQLRVIHEKNVDSLVELDMVTTKAIDASGRETTTSNPLFSNSHLQDVPLNVPSSYVKEHNAPPNISEMVRQYKEESKQQEVCNSEHSSRNSKASESYIKPISGYITKSLASVPTGSSIYTPGLSLCVKDVAETGLYKKENKYKVEKHISSLLRSLKLDSQMKEVSNLMSNHENKHWPVASKGSICDVSQQRQHSGLSTSESAEAGLHTYLTEPLNRMVSDYTLHSKVESNKMSSPVMEQGILDQATVSPLKIEMIAENIADTVLCNFENHLSQTENPLKKSIACEGLYPSEIMSLANKIVTSVLQQLICINTRGVCETKICTLFEPSVNNTGGKHDFGCVKEKWLKEFNHPEKKGSLNLTLAFSDDLTASIISNVLDSVLILKADCDKLSSDYKPKVIKHFSQAEIIPLNLNLSELNYKKGMHNHAFSVNAEYISSTVSKAIIRILLDSCILEEYIAESVEEREKKYIFRYDKMSHDFDKISHNLVSTVVEMLYRSFRVLPDLYNAAEIPNKCYVKFDAATASLCSEITSTETISDISDCSVDPRKTSQSELRNSNELNPENRNGNTEIKYMDSFEAVHIFENCQLEAPLIRNGGKVNAEGKENWNHSQLNYKCQSSRSETPLSVDTLIHPAISTYNTKHFCNQKREVSKTESALLSFLTSSGAITSSSQETCFGSSEDQNITFSDSDQMVEKVFNIIVDSFLSDESQSRNINMDNLETEAHRSTHVSSPDGATPFTGHSSHPKLFHASKTLSIMGFSDPSITLLKVVSEKLVRKMLQKCLFRSTTHLTNSFNCNSPPVTEGNGQQFNTLHYIDNNSVLDEETSSILDEFSQSLGNSVMDILYHNFEQPMENLISDNKNCSNVRSTESTSLQSPSRLIFRENEHYLTSDTDSSVSKCNDAKINLEHNMLLCGEFNERSASETKQKTCPLRNEIASVDNNIESWEPRQLSDYSGSINLYKEGINESDFCIGQHELNVGDFKCSYKMREREQFEKHSLTDFYVEKMKHSLHHELFPSFHICILTNSLIEEIKTKLLSKMFLITQFPVNENIENNGSNIGFCEKVAKLMDTVMINMLKKQMKIQCNTSEVQFLKPLSADLVDCVIDSVYNKTLCQSGSQFALYRDISDKSDIIAERIAILITSVMSDYQWQLQDNRHMSTVSYSPSETNNIFRKIQNNISMTCKQRQASVLVEEILKTFLRKIFLFGVTDMQPNYNENIRQFVNTVLVEIAQKNISGAEGGSVEQPFYEISDVVEEIADSIYCNILQISKDEEELFQCITGYSYSIAKEVSELLFVEIHTYHLECYFNGLKSSFWYMNVNSEHIVQNILSDFTSGREQAQTYKHLKSKVTASYICKIKGNDSASKNETRSQHLNHGTKVCSVTFLEDILVGLLSKIIHLYYENADYMENKTLSENEKQEIVMQLLRVLLLEFAKQQIVLSKKALKKDYYPQINDDVVDKVVCTVYDTLSQRYESGISFLDNMNEINNLGEKIACLIIIEISNYHLRPCLSKDLSWYTPSTLDFTSIIKNILNNSSILITHEQISASYICMVSWEFLETIVTHLLSKLAHISENITAHTEDKKSLSNDTALLAKLTNAVIVAISKYHIWIVSSSVDVWWPYEVSVNTVVNSVCSILKNCKSKIAMQKCLTNMNPFLVETIASLIIKYILLMNMHSPLDREINNLTYRNTNSNAIIKDTNDFRIFRHQHQKLPLHKSCLEDTGHFMSDTNILSYTIIEAVVTNIVSKMFPSLSGLDTSTKIKCDSTKSSLSEIASLLIDETILEFSKHDILITRDVCEEQCFYLDKEIENIVETIHEYILKSPGSTTQMLAERRIDSQMYVHNVSSIIVREVITNYDHLFKTEEAAICQSASSSTCYTQNCRCILTKCNKKSQQLSEHNNSCYNLFLEEIISGLILKILPFSSETDEELKEMINDLLDLILVDMNGALVTVNTSDEGGSQLVNTKNVNSIVNSLFNDLLLECGSDMFINANVSNSNNNLSRAISDMLLAKLFNGNIELCVSGEWLSTVQINLNRENIVENLQKGIQKNGKEIPTFSNTYMLPSSLAEAIITAILIKIFPPFPSFAKTTSKSRLSKSVFDSKVTSLMCLLKMECSKNGICVKSNTKESQIFDQNDVENVVNTIYSCVMVKAGSQLALQKAIETENKVIVDYMINVIILEASTYLIYTFDYKEESSSFSTPVSDYLSFDNISGGFELTSERPNTIPLLGGLYYFPFIEEIISRILSKLLQTFTYPMCVNYKLTPVDEVNEVTRELIYLILMEMSTANIGIMHSEEHLQPVDENIVFQIVEFVFNNILEEFGSQLIDHRSTLTDKMFVKRMVCLICAEIADYQLDPTFIRNVPQSFSTLDAEQLYEKVQNNICRKTLSSSNRMFKLSPTLLEEIIAKVLLKILILPNYITCTETRNMFSKTILYEVVTKMTNSLFIEMFNQLPDTNNTNEELCHPPEESDDFSDSVIDYIYNIILKIYGSEEQLCKNITNNLFLKQISKLLAREMTNYQPCIVSQSLCDLFRSVEKDNIIERILSGVAAYLLTGLTETSFAKATADITAVKQAPGELEKIESALTKITPHIKMKPMKIDPFIVSEHLGVISIKTETIETLKKQFLNSTGLSLSDVRKASVSGKSVRPVTFAKSRSPESEKENGEGKRSLLDRSGRLNVRPREIVYRNSFLDLINPDIGKVELLKDAQNKQDIIIRLVAHDIDHSLKEADGNEENDLQDDYDFRNERVIKEENCFESHLFIPMEVESNKEQTFNTLTDMDCSDLESYFRKKLSVPPDNIEIQDQTEALAKHTDSARTVTIKQIHSFKETTVQNIDKNEDPKSEESENVKQEASQSRLTKGHIPVLDQKSEESENVKQEARQSRLTKGHNPVLDSGIFSTYKPRQKRTLCGKLSSAFTRAFTKK